MISCSALQITLYALTVNRSRREKYITIAEHMFEEFAFYNFDSKKIIEPGRFKIYAGDSCLVENSAQIEIIVKK